MPQKSESRFILIPMKLNNATTAFVVQVCYCVQICIANLTSVCLTLFLNLETGKVKAIRAIGALLTGRCFVNVGVRLPDATDVTLF